MKNLYFIAFQSLQKKIHTLIFKLEKVLGRFRSSSSLAAASTPILWLRTKRMEDCSRSRSRLGEVLAEPLVCDPPSWQARPRLRRPEAPRKAALARRRKCGAGARLWQARVARAESIRARNARLRGRAAAA